MSIDQKKEKKEMMNNNIYIYVPLYMHAMHRL
jgi:hypothetical protein